MFEGVQEVGFLFDAAASRSMHNIMTNHRGRTSLHQGRHQSSHLSLVQSRRGRKGQGVWLAGFGGAFHGPDTVDGGVAIRSVHLCSGTQRTRAEQAATLTLCASWLETDARWVLEFTRQRLVPRHRPLTADLRCTGYGVTLVQMPCKVTLAGFPGGLASCAFRVGGGGRGWTRGWKVG